MILSKDKLETLLKQTRKKNNLYQPLFYRLSDQNDRHEFQKLLDQEPPPDVFEELDGQLQELVKSLHPKILFKNEPGLLDIKIKEHTSGIPHEEYGVWVYYPWSNRLLHILDRDEFIAVRTNRNQYKITREEQDRLATKKVGVMGLSVGQSVSVTMAMERGFGEIRLADFDLLELTNYNRIRTGLHNLGINKAVSTAREIAEIDPFLKVTCYTDGITEENMRDFLEKDGRLDLLIDECDGLHIKILARILAKEMNIPVIMEASDRSAIDVERFDLEPSRPILHGWLSHLDVSKVREAKTNEEKIPYLLAMLKMDTVSPKFKATMLEIEQTVTTWPQLAAEVTGGGGLMANIARRINLGQFHDSGRYYVDVDELIADKQPEQEKETSTPDPASIPPPPLTKEDMNKAVTKINSAFTGKQIAPDRLVIEHLVAAAAQAPSGGNNQPWKWLYKNGLLFLFHDMHRSVSFVDYDHVAANVALGAAIETLVISAQQAGLEISVDMKPLAADPVLAAVFRFFTEADDATEARTNASLTGFIGRRCTNRLQGNGQPVDAAVSKQLVQAVESVPGAQLLLIDAPESIQKLGHIITSAERLRFMHPQGHHELFNTELRWTDEESERKRDGIPVKALNLTASEIAGMYLAKDERVIALLRQWQGGKGFEKLSKKAVDSASAFGLITMPSYTPENYIRGGRAVQRMWLTATKNNVAVYPMTGPLFLFPRLMYGGGIGMNDAMLRELPVLRKKFADLFRLKENMGEIFLFRLCYAEEPSLKSLRRDLNDIFCFEK